MAIEPQVAGLVTVKVGTGSAGALEDLGYTINGVDIEDQHFWLDIHGDEHGGDAGPPVDVQWMGTLSIIRLEMSKWDEAILVKVRPGLRGSVAGEVLAADIGKLVFAGAYSYRIALDALNAGFDRDFPRCIFRDPVVVNRGTKHSICRLTAYAYRSAPVSGNARVYDDSVAAIAMPDDPVIVDLNQAQDVKIEAVENPDSVAAALAAIHTPPR